MIALFATLLVGPALAVGLSLDTELVRLADTTDGDLDRQLKMAVALAEPFILFIMAALIGFIIIAMVLPIFNLHDFIK